MPEHVLVPIDGSSQSSAALAFAAEEWPDAEITLLHVLDPVSAGYSAGALVSSGEEWYERINERAEEYFEAAREQVGRDLDAVAEVGRPSKTIVAVAKSEGADHIVMGSHGRDGVSRILLGSVAADVVRKAPVPVTIVR